MQLYILTAETNSGNGYPAFLGFVVGRTLEEAKQKARKKWHWYESTNDMTLYYAGYPEVTTHRRTVKGD